MKKNVASQVIGAEMITAADGTAFTGSVTAYVTGDGGSQAQGSTGSGACTHEGNGFHTYVPAQSETNYDHVAFTFIGTGAIPVTIQVYPSFPQTGDGYARLGAPAGASVSADIAAIEGQTDDIGVAGAGLTAVPWNAAWDAEVQSEVADALAVYDPPTRAEATSDKDEILTAVATVDDFLDTEIAAIIAAIDVIDNFLDTEVAAILTDTNELQSDWTDGGRLDLLIDAIKAITDQFVFTTANRVNAQVFGMQANTVTASALAADAVDEILDEVVEGSITLRQVMRVQLAALAGILDGAATTTVTIRDQADTIDRITATVDADGNRSAVTLNLA